MALAGFALAASAVQANANHIPTLEHMATLALTLAGQGTETSTTKGTAPGTVTESYQASIETRKLSNKELLMLLDAKHVLPPGGISGWSISILSQDGDLQGAFLTKKGQESIEIDQYLDVSAEDSLDSYTGKTITKSTPSASETTTESYSFKGLASIDSDAFNGYNFETQGLYIGNGTYNSVDGYATLGAFSFSSILGVLRGTQQEENVTQIGSGFNDSELKQGGDSIIEGWIKATSGKAIIFES